MRTLDRPFRPTPEISAQTLDRAFEPVRVVIAEHLPGKHDQTRHGRGKGQMPKAEFESLLHGDATDALKGTFPNLDRAHLGGMTPENRAEAIEALNDLGRRYPKTAATLRQVNTTDLGHSNLAETDMRTGVITFNRRGYDGGPTDKGLHAMAKVVVDGKPVLVDASAGGAATHEYAHLMEQTTLKRREHWPWAHDSLPYIGPSGYGSSSYDLSERLAELVTARVRGKPLGANEIDFVDRFIADVEGEKAVYGVSEALAEHLPGKHDQARHGRGGARAGGSLSDEQLTAFGGAEPVARRAPSGPVTYENLAAAEEAIRGQEVEHLVIAKPGGKAYLLKQGDENSIDMSDEELAATEGMILTHNHPAALHMADMDVKYHDSLSVADISTGIASNVAEIRAVTPNWTFSLKPGQGGWVGTGRKPTGVELNQFGAVYNDIRDAVHYRLLGQAARAGNMDILLDEGHLTNIEYAKRLGWTYTSRSKHD